jgi:hypothetical protein
MKQLLDRDPTVLCVSAWNDNGRPGLVRDEAKAYRSDFFPGLGWMLHVDLWKELGPKYVAIRRCVTSQMGQPLLGRLVEGACPEKRARLHLPRDISDLHVRTQG